jgi:hypothetical protein
MFFFGGRYPHSDQLVGLSGKATSFLLLLLSEPSLAEFFEDFDGCVGLHEPLPPTLDLRRQFAPLLLQVFFLGGKHQFVPSGIQEVFYRHLPWGCRLSHVLLELKSFRLNSGKLGSQELLGSQSGRQFLTTAVSFLPPEA